ncbi:hypothetical protein ACTXGL_01515 [Psychrobacter sp. T6-6]|uniref:hypothetical protein n=1 Tax=Psychrobacter sp. T6-6 TaxID=3457452 RepID=UPI003FD0139E
MRSDHATHLELVQDAEQNHQPQHQVKQANQAYKDRTTIDSNWFLVRAMRFLTVVTLAAVAYRLIVMWWV